MDEQAPPPEGQEEEGIPLIEGWMFGVLLFPYAMGEVVRVPPANDNPPRT
ncbi:hypothetical protein [Crenalkalicoccus roseus]|nr:hypothetical protein [Crenalkalicoccus roseus]